MQVDRYSRMVAWLKVVLPLAALGLLSTLFLLSRAIDPTAAIPFADTEIKDRVEGQQVTGPIFSGISSGGDQITFTATKLTTRNGANLAHDVRAELSLVGGNLVTLQSKDAEFDMTNNRTTLTGGVEIAMSNGYQMQTSQLIAQMTELDITAPNALTAKGPFGDIQSGQMRLFRPDPDSGAQLLFTNGVKLLYDPKQVKD
ncbi:MAG: hypothetical protein WBC93_08960 [Sulfitobacter sp.]